jgi:tRNA-dihydrouridine synthase
MNIYQKLPRPFFVLAPMDDVSDTVFRQIIQSCHAPDLFFTEFVSVDGLQSAGRAALLDKLRYAANERPLIAQLWGKNIQAYQQTARELCAMGFDGIDLNMGCPDKTILKHGCCAALIQNRDMALNIIHATQDAVSGRIPISVKTRLGFDDVDLSWHELLLKQSLDALTIHARTRRDMSKVPARWSYLSEIVAMKNTLAPNTVLIGNGDVAHRQQAQNLAQHYQLDGIMIGRGIFSDPFAFSLESPWPTMPMHDRLELYRTHIKTFIATWPMGERRIQTLNKFCKIYIQGCSGAAHYREMLMSCRSVDELFRTLDVIELQIENQS